jgi:hypothetical protein
VWSLDSGFRGAFSQRNELPHVGFDAAGNAVAIWEQSDLATSLVTIWSATRSAQGAWAAPVQIDGTAGMQFPPHSRLAVATGGSAIAVWQQSLNGLYALPFAAVYNGSAWGAPTALSADVAPAQSGANLDPRVAILNNASAVVVWAQDMGASCCAPDFGPQIYVARFAAGSWTPGGRLSSNGSGYGFSGTPDVAMTAVGDAVVVWDQDVSGDRVLVTRVAAGSTAPSGQALLDATPSTIGKDPRVAVDSSGNATVVWVEHQATASVYGSRIPAGSLQGTAVRLDTGAPGPNAAEALVAVDGIGNATAVWRETANDPRSIWANRFTGGAWTGAVAIESAAAEGTNPALALDDQGDAMVAWETGAGVKAALFTIATASWGSAVVLNPQAAVSGTPDIAFAHGCPRALAVWSQGAAVSDAGNIYSAFYH